MRRILIPVDGSEHAMRAVAFVCDLAGDAGGIEVVLLNVQPTPELRSLAQVRDAMMVELNQIGAYVMRCARRQLVVPYKERIEVGPVAETIVKCAREEGCNQIVMGAQGTGVTRLVLGSVAHKVLHMAEVPVTFIK